MSPALPIRLAHERTEPHRPASRNALSRAGAYCARTRGWTALEPRHHHAPSTRSSCRYPSRGRLTVTSDVARPIIRPLLSSSGQLLIAVRLINALDRCKVPGALPRAPSPQFRGLVTYPAIKVRGSDTDSPTSAVRNRSAGTP